MPISCWKARRIVARPQSGYVCPQPVKLRQRRACQVTRDEAVDINTYIFEVLGPAAGRSDATLCLGLSGPRLFRCSSSTSLAQVSKTATAMSVINLPGNQNSGMPLPVAMPWGMNVSPDEIVITAGRWSA